NAERASWKVHVHGTLRRTERVEPPARVDLAELRSRLGTTMPAEQLYPKLAAIGFGYGPAFQGVAEVRLGEGEMLGRVRLPAAAGAAGAYRLHPALLDACLHVAGAAAAVSEPDDTEGWVPVEVGSLRLFQRPSGELWSYVQSADHGQRTPDRQSYD